MDLSTIIFNTEGVDIEINDVDKIKFWIAKTIHQEEKNIGDLCFIFCTDEYLLTVNQEYLMHDTYTDIISFNYVEGKLISGDIFISLDRVKENAENFLVPFDTELSRVIIHGVLHLIGYDDKTTAEAQEIRAKEDFYLTLRPWE